MRLQPAFLFLLTLGLLLLPACGEKSAPAKGAASHENGAASSATSPTDGVAKKPAPEAARAQGAETPAAVIERIKKGAEAEAWGEFVACIAPGERPLLSASFVVLTQMMPMFLGMAVAFAQDDEKKKEAEARLTSMQTDIENMLKRHGLENMVQKLSESGEAEGMADANDPEKLEALTRMMNEVAPNLDHGAFIGDVFATLSKLGEGSGAKTSGPTEKFALPLTDLTIDGDKASGLIGEDPVHFVRENGRWFISAKSIMGDEGE